ncbi:MAG: hypothetical protein ACLT40_03620 [Fusobacterium sp.]
MKIKFKDNIISQAVQFTDTKESLEEIKKIFPEAELIETNRLGDLIKELIIRTKTKDFVVPKNFWIVKYPEINIINNNQDNVQVFADYVFKQLFEEVKK